MRKPESGEKPLRSVEGELLNELQTTQPEAFIEVRTAFGEWVLAQHHRLPTRLLDVTHNPLVALFNACTESESTNGRMHVFAVPKELIKPFNSDTVSVIASFAKLSRWEKNLLLGKIEADVYGDEFHRLSGFRGHDLIDRARTRLYDGIRQEKPYFQERLNVRDLFTVFVVEPQKIFERLRAQSGAFLVSAFHERFEPREVLKWNQDIPIYSHYVQAVPHAKKENILKELRLLNISRETLFPSIEESAKAAKSKFLSRSESFDSRLTPQY